MQNYIKPYMQMYVYNTTMNKLLLYYEAFFFVCIYRVERE